MDEEQIYHAARALGDPEARAAFLRDACAGDAHVLDRVAALLLIAERDSRFLEVPPLCGASGESPSPRAEEAGMSIGPYRLMEAIGEGGMGVVYVADQTQPVRRRVALKVIKPGMDTRQVVARFEAERQALAMMDHPNIARVLDCGTAPSGRPYFVMELVRGLPITEYCDREKLSIRERLALFILVCRAVQHAHQKGIIHRDLKPSNVLVTVIDGAPVPKVIDFGIAKATGQALTDKTIYTAFHQFVGTPLYVSPEQAELSGVDVDTRSDIYSLGVLLYELLTGTTPFDSETLRAAAFDEMRRILREEEPPRPSARLSTLGETLTTISARRKADPRRLGASFKGELDWVVMKALEKARQRRYQTASDFAADIQRYLSDQPVEAGRPSSWYRLAKYARRHRVELAAVSAVVLVLSLATAFSVAQAWRAMEAEARAEADFRMAHDAVDRMLQRVSDDLTTVPGALAVHRSLLVDTLSFYQSFLSAHRGDPRVRFDAARALYRVAKIRWFIGDSDGMREPVARALALMEELMVDEPKLPVYRYERADCHSLNAQFFAEKLGRFEADRERQAAISLLQGLVDEFPRNGKYLRRLAGARCDLGSALISDGRDEAAGAEWHLRKALETWARVRREFPPEPGDDDESSRLHLWMGRCLALRGDAAAAEGEYRTALTQARSAAAERPGHPAGLVRLAHVLHFLGELLIDRGDRAEGERVLREAVEVSEPIFRGFPDVRGYAGKAVVMLRRLGISQWEGGNPAEACATYARAVGLKEAAAQAHGYSYSYVKTFTTYLGEHGQVLRDAGRVDEALAAFRRMTALYEEYIERYPTQLFLRTELAWWLTTCPDHRLRDTPRALKVVAGAAEVNASHEMTLGVKGIAAYRNGDFAAARAALEEALRVGRQDPAMMLYLAMACARMGDTDRARHWYAAGTHARDPWYPSARINEQLAAEARGVIPDHRPELTGAHP